MILRILLLLTFLHAGATAAVAQDAPVRSDVSCAVEPRSAEELLDLWFDSDGAPRSPASSSAQLTERALDFTLDEPVDAFTVEAIETVVQEWAACTNAGDQLRAYTLLTDDYAQQGPVGASRDEARTMLATSPVPVSPEAAVSVGSAHDARVFPDGQAGATFATIGVRDPGEALTVFMLFEQPDGRWRIDGMTGVVAPAPTAPVWDYRVVAEYPHDTGAYTQGLVISDGQLFEGTGQWEESELRRVDLETGEVLQSHPLDPELFGEGIVVLGDRIYQLTWQAGICFVYDRETFELLETFTYSGEGWGLTTDGERLIMSDGSSRLVFRDPETFSLTGYVDVEDGGLPVSYLNELEYVEGEVWANVYTTDRIVRIDPASGNVIGWIDLAGLLPPDYPQAEDAEVLNGIAYNPETGRVFVTGKYWPAVFEIELVPPE